MSNLNIKTKGDVRSDDDFFIQLKLLRPSCTESNTSLTIASATFTKSNGQVVRAYITNKPSNFSGSTVNLATDPAVVALPSNSYAKALVTIDGNDNISILVGTYSLVGFSGTIEPTSSNYPIALVKIHKTGAVLDNITNANIEDRRPLNQSQSTSTPTRAYEMISEQYLAQIYDEFLYSPNTDDNSVDFTLTDLSQLQNGSTSNAMLMHYSTRAGTVSGGVNLTLGSIPSFTVRANCWVTNGSVFSRITSVITQQSFTLATALPNGSYNVTVLEPVVTKDLYNNVGNASQQTRLIDTFSQTVDNIIVDYDDSATLNDFDFDGGIPNVVALASTSNVDTYVSILRPTSKNGYISDVTVSPAATNLKLVFLPNKTIGDGTVNLIRYACLFLKDPEVYRGGIFNQAYGFTDGGSGQNCTFSVVSGKTVITLNGSFPSYVPGINPNSPYGDIIVIDSGVEIPRQTLGVTDDTMPYYTETAANQITLWGQFDTALTRRQISIIRRFGTLDTSDQNATFIANLKFNGFNFSTFVIGNATQVSQGLAQYSSIQTAHNALPSQGGKLFILAGAYVENVTFSKPVVMEGLGRTSQITGTLTLNGGSDYSSVKEMRITGNVTVNSNGNFINELWLATGSSVTDNGSANDINYVTE